MLFTNRKISIDFVLNFYMDKFSSANAESENQSSDSVSRQNVKQILLGFLFSCSSYPFASCFAKFFREILRRLEFHPLRRDLAVDAPIVIFRFLQDFNFIRMFFFQFMDFINPSYFVAAEVAFFNRLFSAVIEACFNGAGQYSHLPLFRG